MTKAGTAAPVTVGHRPGGVRIPWAKPYFGPEELALLVETARSGWLSQGPRVEAFEARVRELTGIAHCVAVNNGTSALDVALKLIGVRAGSEVLVPSFAYIASVNCVLYQDAVPVFVDVDPVTLNLDPEDARRKITAKTRAIIAIDYAGHGADWDSLRALSRETGIPLVEDGAPSFGGRFRDRALCTFGDLGITSFHTAKVFTSVEGGMVFCSTAEQAEQARIIRSQGESLHEKYVHPRLGHNYRLSDLHAAIGLGQLARFRDVLGRRAAAARYYGERLAAARNVVLPAVLDGHVHAWFLYVVRLPRRDAVRRRLCDMGIETNVSWPYPAYAQEHLKAFFRSACPVAEDACGSVLSLPMYYELTRSEQDVVVDALTRAVDAER